jgi:hypothetical protein
MSDIVVSGIAQANDPIYCPDCETWIVGSQENFTTHRESHAGRAITLAVSGIRSQEAHGYQPPPTSEEE